MIEIDGLDIREARFAEPGYAHAICVDEGGSIWSSGANRVHCIDPDERLLSKVPHCFSSLTFAGASKNRVFIGGSHTLYAMFLNRCGALSL